MRSNYKRIGDYIREVKVKNKDLIVNTLMGINIDKHFMPSVANIVGTDMSKYKIVKEGQFACNRMHVGRDKRLPIALHKYDENIIVSPAYTVFEIIDENILNREYLMMWVSRKEFDREAWFYTDSDVRGGLSLIDFFDIKIPILPIEKQREIVREYNALVDKLNINNKIIYQLENLGDEIFKEYFNFKKESMTTDKETNLGKYVKHSKKLVKPSNFKENIFSHFSIPAYDINKMPILDIGKNIKSSKYIINEKCILISKLNPNFSRVWSIYSCIPYNSICSTEFQILVPNNEKYFGFVYFYLKSEVSKNYLISMATGTSNSHQRVKPDTLLQMPLHKFDDLIIYKFNKIVIPFIKIIELKRKEIIRIENLKEILLTKISTMGE